MHYYCSTIFNIFTQRESLENVNTSLRILTALAEDCPEETLLRSAQITLSLYACDFRGTATFTVIVLAKINSMKHTKIAKIGEIFSCLTCYDGFTPHTVHVEPGCITEMAAWHILRFVHPTLSPQD